MFSSWNHTASCCHITTKSLHFIGFCSLLLTISLYAAYVQILRTCKIIHGNLKLILFVISTIDISVLSVRMVDFLDFSGQYDFGLTMQNSIKMILFSMEIMSLFNLLAERMIALYAYRWYDRSESACPHVIVIIYTIQFIAVIFAYRTVQNDGAQIYVAALFFSALVALVSTFLCTLLARRRQKWVKRKRFSLTRHSISGQYQMVENERCDRVIVMYIPFQVVSFFLTTFLGGFLVFQVQQKDPRSFLLYQSLLYLTIAPRVMISMLIPIIRHPALWKAFMKTFKRMRQILGDSSVSPQSEHTIVHSTGGKQLSYSSKTETEIYFENLANSWG